MVTEAKRVAPDVIVGEVSGGYAENRPPLPVTLSGTGRGGRSRYVRAQYSSDSDFTRR